MKGAIVKTVRLAGFNGSLRSFRHRGDVLPSLAGSMVLMAALLGGAMKGEAQSLRTLWSFSGGTDGALPTAALLQGTNGILYGTTSSGGSSGLGTIFQISSDGEFQSLYSFGAITNGAGVALDGANPSSGLVLGTNGNFYGTTTHGGTNNVGTVFELSPTGAVTTVYCFGSVMTNPNPMYPQILLALDGAGPGGGLVLGSDGNFYGTTSGGGTNDGGTVFRITHEGTLTSLHQFPANQYPPFLPEGTDPAGALVEGNDGNFYGTTVHGGTNDAGTAFMITPAGGFETLCQFGNPYAGMYPESGLTLGSDGNFYGTTFHGGVYCCDPIDGFPWGNVFQLSTNGAVTVIYSFDGGGGGGTNTNDRGGPVAGLVLGRDGNFYGTTELGLIYGANHNSSLASGSVFRISPQGSLTTLWEFCSVSTVMGCLDGQNPKAGLIQAQDGSFYGSTYAGGAYGFGTVFRLDPTAPAKGPGGGYLNCVFNLGQSNSIFTAQGGTKSVSVQAQGTNCSWTASSNDPFVQILKGSNGIGGGMVTYAVLPNPNVVPRVGSMTIAGQAFTVLESGLAENDCAYTLSATNVSLPAAGGSKSVSVKAKGTGCNWAAMSDSAFITLLNGTNGSGNGTVTFRALPNTTGSARLGEITIAGQFFTVEQAAGTCSYAVSPHSASVTAGGGTFTISVTPNFTNCSWTAVSDAPFIQIISGSSGTGKGKATYTVATNSNASNRTGTMTVAGQTITVTQAGAGCVFSLAPLSANFGSAGGAGMVDVNANDSQCSWAAASRSSFITVTSGRSGTGDGVVNYTVSSNHLASSRSGTITIAGHSFLIHQLGQTNLLGACASEISTAGSPPEGGITAGDGTYPCGSTQVISASPNIGWSFSGWSDGIGGAVRVITVPDVAATFTALFNQQMALITVLPSPAEGGTTTGTDLYPVNSQVMISAEANTNDGWNFSKWSDGNTDNPRAVNVPPEGATYTALFSRPAPVIVLDPPELRMSQNVCLGEDAAGTLSISNAGPAESTLNYQISCDSDWVVFSSTTGSLAGGQSDSIDISIADPNIPFGTYTALITVSDTAGAASPQTVPVILKVNDGCLAGTTWSGFWVGRNYCCTGGAFGPTVGVSGTWQLQIDSADAVGGSFSGTLTWSGTDGICLPVNDSDGITLDFQRQPLEVGIITNATGTISVQNDCQFQLTFGDGDNSVYGPFLQLTLDLSTGQVENGSSFITHPQPPPDSDSGCTGLTLGSLIGFGPLLGCSSGGNGAILIKQVGSPDRPASRSSIGHPVEPGSPDGLNRGHNSFISAPEIQRSTRRSATIPPQ